MKIWELRSSENSMAIRSKNNMYSNYLTEYFNGKPMKDWWKPITFEVYKKGRYMDFPYYSFGVPVFTHKCLEVLNPLIHKNIELLDIDVIGSDQRIMLVNVISLLDALDYDRSDIEYLPSGKLSFINEYFFREEIVRNVPIFKIVEKPGSYVFVSDEFRDLVLSSNLKGFEFIEVWDSEFTVDKELEQKNRYKAKLAEIERTKGPEFDWAEAYKKIENGQAVRSEKWKLQKDKEGNFLVGHLSEDGSSYYWTDPIYLPPILLDLKWHETDKSDI